VCYVILFGSHTHYIVLRNVLFYISLALSLRANNTYRLPSSFNFQPLSLQTAAGNLESHRDDLPGSIVSVQRSELRMRPCLYKMPTFQILQFFSPSSTTNLSPPQPRLTNLKPTCRPLTPQQLEALKTTSAASAPNPSTNSVLHSLSTPAVTSSASPASNAG
jgi:hypothetical protein